jgi:LPS-assembly lipoprotein
MASSASGSLIAADVLMPTVCLLSRCLLLCLALAVSSCGWRLQGIQRLPPAMSITYVDAADPYSDFNRALRESLKAAGAELVEDSKQARAIIRVRRDESGQRVLSVSARNRPEEYEVFYIVEYSVEGVGGELLEVQMLERKRDYSYDEAALLAKQREQEILTDALARELAGLVLRRLAAL